MSGRDRRCGVPGGLIRSIESLGAGEARTLVGIHSACTCDSMRQDLQQPHSGRPFFSRLQRAAISARRADDDRHPNRSAGAGTFWHLSERRLQGHIRYGKKKPGEVLQFYLRWLRQRDEKPPKNLSGQARAGTYIVFNPS